MAQDPNLRRRSTDVSPEDDLRRSLEIDHVAQAAARAAADLVSTAAAAAAQVSATAASAAHSLAQENRMDLGYIKRDLEQIKTRLDNKFVSIEAFEPIRKLVHGVVALILVAVVGGLLALVIRQ